MKANIPYTFWFYRKRKGVVKPWEGGDDTNGVQGNGEEGREAAKGYEKVR